MTTVRLGLTRNQRELWASERRATDRRMYTIAQHVEIRGPLELTAFEDAVRQVIAETETLRARFREDGGEVVQEILPSIRWRLALIDLSGCADPVSAFEDWVAADQREPILATDFPLFSTALLRLGTDHYRWYLRFHQMAMDGFSAGLLLRRVAEVYAALCTGGDAGPGLVRPIATLHEELLAYEKSARFQADRAFWRERLSGFPAPVRIAPDGVAGTTVLSGVGLATPPAEDIRRTATAAGTAWPDVIMAVVAAHAAAECGVRDVVMTVMVSNRTTAVSRGVATNMTNRIFVAIAVRPEESFHELLTRVAVDNRDAVRHQNFPYRLMLADLGEQAVPINEFGPIVNIMPFGGDLVLPGCATSVHRIQTGPLDDFEVAVYGGPDASRMGVNVLMALRPEDHALLRESERRLMDRFTSVTADPTRPMAELPGFADVWAPAKK